MRSRSRAAAATFGANAVNAVIVGIQAIILVPLYLHAIGPRLYGAWLGSAEILVWLQAMDFGIPNLMIQRIASAYAQGDRPRAANWFAAGVLVLTATSVLIGLAGVGVAFVLPRLVGVAPDQQSLLTGGFLVGSVATSVTLVANGFVGLARAIQDTYFLSGALVVSAIAGFATSLVLLLAGFGLWAIPLGLVARAAVGLVAALVFSLRAWRVDFRVPFQIDRGIVRELVTTSPVTALGGISYTVMSQSEIVLVAVLLRPELAVTYALTRRAADLGRSLVDMIGFASYGGMAHLLSSPDRATARNTYARILALHLSCAVAVGAAYLAVNRSLVDVWVGPLVSGGLGLIFLMSLQSIALGHSYLINLLFRATGRVVEGSFYLVLEALVRIPLLAILLLFMGMPGLPIAAITTALISAVVVWRRTIHELGERRPERLAMTIWIVRALAFAVASTLAVYVTVPRWPYVLIVGALIFVGSCAVQVYADRGLRPMLGTVRQLLPAAVSVRL